MNSGGDVLARGGRSAQFASSGSDVSDFEYDMKVRRELVKETYGLSDAEIEEHAIRINAGERFDLPKVDAQVEKLGAGIEVIDRRHNYLTATQEVKEAAKVAPKYPEKRFSLFQPILDRILIKRCADGPDKKIMEDGSVLDTKTGIITAARYRQHSNIGIVLATGRLVILGGQKLPMEDVVKVGDRVTYGDYNSEVFHMDEERVKSLCDAVQMNYEPDPEGLRIVRVQDVRGVEPPCIIRQDDDRVCLVAMTSAPKVDVTVPNYGELKEYLEAVKTAAEDASGAAEARVKPVQPLYEDEDGKLWKYNELTAQWDLPVLDNPEVPDAQYFSDELLAKAIVSEVTNE